MTNIESLNKLTELSNKHYINPEYFEILSNSSLDRYKTKYHKSMEFDPLVPLAFIVEC